MSHSKNNLEKQRENFKYLKDAKTREDIRVLLGYKTLGAMTSIIYGQSLNEKYSSFSLCKKMVESERSNPRIPS